MAGHLAVLAELKMKAELPFTPITTGVSELAVRHPRTRAQAEEARGGMEAVVADLTILVEEEARVFLVSMSYRPRREVTSVTDT